MFVALCLHRVPALRERSLEHRFILLIVFFLVCCVCCIFRLYKNAIAHLQTRLPAVVQLKIAAVIISSKSNELNSSAINITAPRLDY